MTTDSGQETASYWEDVTLSEMKTGTRADKVYERSIVLPAGSYRGAFGLFSADGATALASASATFRIEPEAGGLRRLAAHPDQHADAR